MHHGAQMQHSDVKVSEAVTTTANEPRPARVLHISDLHFGRRFQPGKWDSLKQSARSIDPDLVVVTGDLVNTPWFWMLRRARRELQSFAAGLGGGESGDCPRELWVIPGNHDTRITGLLPVRWLLPLVCACVLLAAGCWSLGQINPPLPPWAHRAVVIVAWFFGVCAVVALVLRFLVSVDLKRALGSEYFLSEARCSERIPIGIVPFDSASQGVSWARGRVADYNFSSFRNGMSAALEKVKGAKEVTWIAAVHHHPLPLPYDDSTERMMAMDNAGAFMSELSQAGIRLVLHGHKHHQHFARITVDPAQSQSSELAVLSAGTPTNSRSAGAFWHGFNVVDIDEEKRARITMYEAPPRGGGFVLKRIVDLAPLEEQDRNRYEREVTELGTSCERMLCVAEINTYGDARFVREFRGVCTTHHALGGLPGPYVAATSRGLVEAFIARSLCQWGPAVTLRPKGGGTLGRLEGEIRFGGSGLQKSDQPIDFALEFYANNAFALNQWQFECMYMDGQRRDSPREYLRFRAPMDLAVRELLIHVRFPDDMPLPRRLDLRQRTGAEESGIWRVLSRDCLIRIESQCVVEVRIPFPMRGSLFEINWEPRENLYAQPNTARERDIGRALVLRDRFAQLGIDQVPSSLKELLANLEINARNLLGVGEREQEQAYDVSLFAFHGDSKILRYVAGTFAESDARRQGTYAFGLGTVGRAFKTGASVAFRRPPYSPDERPWGYVMPDGSRVVDRNKVPEAVILSIPLAPPEAVDWPYAVVQISTDSATCVLKTANTASDSSVELFCAALRELTPDFEGILGLSRSLAEH